ncbi:hypothetical protein CBR_g41215 [Chara braunii]|uniref:DNA polymerase kappa n=1 Tax=Chara braunii TaxID=69332 RepID=A0A388K2M5_CHABU|nr:hypothetical protein CBR_g41215 [Chara braunii]|eukprot:GBG64296.1 hypothetical protein CBR_g41215 [Chara braunii]
MASSHGTTVNRLGSVVGDESDVQAGLVCCPFMSGSGPGKLNADSSARKEEVRGVIMLQQQQQRVPAAAHDPSVHGALYDPRGWEWSDEEGPQEVDLSRKQQRVPGVFAKDPGALRDTVYGPDPDGYTRSDEEGPQEGGDPSRKQQQQVPGVFGKDPGALRDTVDGPDPDGCTWSDEEGPQEGGPSRKQQQQQVPGVFAKDPGALRDTVYGPDPDGCTWSDEEGPQEGGPSRKQQQQVPGVFAKDPGALRDTVYGPDPDGCTWSDEEGPQGGQTDLSHKRRTWKFLMEGQTEPPPPKPRGEESLRPISDHQAWREYETVFTNAKAGMDGVDKQKLQQVVYEMSKGSRFFVNEQRKEATILQRIEGMKERAAEISPEARGKFQAMADRRLLELEASRDLSRVWMHVDMDAFYAAVEALDDPSLRTKPMAVGGTSMICTANYEARKYGVRAAMPGFIARKLCPHLVFVKPDFDKYTRMSELTRQVFRGYDQHFLPRSLDEAYLDITACCKQRGMSASQIAEEIRARVYEVTQLTCSAGIGPNRLIAKICSDINKPNGQYLVPNDRSAVLSFISSLSIRKVSGIGKVSEKTLKGVLSVTTCQELLDHRAMLFALYSRISADFFLAVGLGIGGSEHPKEELRKGISNERTFAPISAECQLIMKLEELAGMLESDMATEELHGRTLTLKLKTVDFEVRTRSVTLTTYICTKEEMMPHAVKLLKAELPISVRLMGLRLSNFKEARVQVSDRSQRTMSEFLSRQQENSEKQQQQQQFLSHAHGIPQATVQIYRRPLDGRPLDVVGVGDGRAPPEEQVARQSGCRDLAAVAADRQMGGVEGKSGMQLLPVTEEFPWDVISAADVQSTSGVSKEQMHVRQVGGQLTRPCTDDRVCSSTSSGVICDASSVRSGSYCVPSCPVDVQTGDKKNTTLAAKKKLGAANVAGGQNKKEEGKCDSHTGQRSPMQADASPIEEEFPPGGTDEQSWACKRCTLVNGSEQGSCEVCRTPKPDVVVKSGGKRPSSSSLSSLHTGNRGHSLRAQKTLSSFLMPLSGQSAETASPPAPSPRMRRNGPSCFPVGMHPLQHSDASPDASVNDRGLGGITAHAVAVERRRLQDGHLMTTTDMEQNSCDRTPGVVGGMRTLSRQYLPQVEAEETVKPVVRSGGKAAVEACSETKAASRDAGPNRVHNEAAGESYDVRDPERGEERRWSGDLATGFERLDMDAGVAIGGEESFGGEAVQSDEFLLCNKDRASRSFTTVDLASKEPNPSRSRVPAKGGGVERGGREGSEEPGVEGVTGSQEMECRKACIAVAAEASGEGASAVVQHEEDNSWVCEICGATVFGGQRAREEHEDYHLALELDKQEKESTRGLHERPQWPVRDSATKRRAAGSGAQGQQKGADMVLKKRQRKQGTHGAQPTKKEEKQVKPSGGPIDAFLCIVKK